MAQDCTRIQLLYNDYKRYKELQAQSDDDKEALKFMYAIADKIGLKDKTEKAVASKAIASKVFQKFVTNKTVKTIANKMVYGAEGPIGLGIAVAVDILTPTEMATGSAQYYDNLKKLLNEYYNGGKEHLQTYYDRLADAQKTIIIEKEFGSNRNCYLAINGITEAVKRDYVDSPNSAFKKR